jgi:hypothetical protein
VDPADRRHVAMTARQKWSYGMFAGPLHYANRLLTVVSRFCAAASIYIAAGGALAEESANVVSPLCGTADVRLVTLIEAHGEAQDVAAETLAKAFFTVMEARKACNRGEVEAALELYDSIPFDAATARGQ